MEVIKVSEYGDGGAELILKITEEEQKIFINYAIVDILKNKIQELEDKVKN